MPTQTFTYTGGLQYFVVPAGITSLNVKAIGARGGLGRNNFQGGLGTSIQGDFDVVPGDTLTILVGGQGFAFGPGTSGGGGGGSFVWRGTDPIYLANLMVAAGGGGGGSCAGPGGNASVGNNGTSSLYRPPFAAGGVGGNGGQGGFADLYFDTAGGGGGAGILTDGGDGQNAPDPFGFFGGQGGTAISDPVNPGKGGTPGTNSSGTGGFGGGGGASWASAGGGGGYSGGGGGSGNNGINQINQAGVGTGNGRVEITFADLADLSVEKEASAETVGVGQPLTYTITVTNNGPQAATGVILTDTVAGTATFTIAANGCTVVANTVTCNIGNLAAGASVVRTIIVTPQTPGTIVDTAVVQGDQTDPNPDNNTVTVTSNVFYAVTSELLINGNLIIPEVKPPAECLIL